MNFDPNPPRRRLLVPCQHGMDSMPSRFTRTPPIMLFRHVSSFCDSPRSVHQPAARSSRSCLAGFGKATVTSLNTMCGLSTAGVADFSLRF